MFVSIPVVSWFRREFSLLDVIKSHTSRPAHVKLRAWQAIPTFPVMGAAECLYVKSYKLAAPRRRVSNRSVNRKTYVFPYPDSGTACRLSLLQMPCFLRFPETRTSLGHIYNPRRGTSFCASWDSLR
jgi:hypothetical protein